MHWPFAHDGYWSLLLTTRIEGLTKNITQTECEHQRYANHSTIILDLGEETQEVEFDVRLATLDIVASLKNHTM